MNINLVIGIDKHGKSSFTHVVGNIQKLKDTYPEFFEKNVHFNAVLHDRNSVEGCYKSIHGLFGKRPRVSELNTNGIIPERVEEFVRCLMIKQRVLRLH